MMKLGLRRIQYWLDEYLTANIKICEAKYKLKIYLLTNILNE